MSKLFDDLCLGLKEAIEFEKGNGKAKCLSLSTDTNETDAEDKSVIDHNLDNPE